MCRPMYHTLAGTLKSCTLLFSQGVTAQMPYQSLRRENMLALGPSMITMALEGLDFKFPGLVHGQRGA